MQQSLWLWLGLVCLSPALAAQETATARTVEVEAAPDIRVFELNNFIAVNDSPSLSGGHEVAYSKASLLGAGRLTLNLSPGAHLLLFGELNGTNTTVVINPELNLTKIQVRGNPGLSNVAAVVSGVGVLASLFLLQSVINSPQGTSWDKNPLGLGSLAGASAVAVGGLVVFWTNRLSVELEP